MRISISALFKVLALIAQDVLAFEAQQTTADGKVETLPSQPPATENQSPVQ